MKFHLAVAVWGDAFIDKFLRFMLPSLFSDGNIFDFPSRNTSQFRIFTRAKDTERIYSAHAVQRLAHGIPVQIIPFEDHNFDANAYAIASACHRQAMEEALADEAVPLMLCPDWVCAQGMFTQLDKLVAQGKRLVMTCGMKVAEETFLPATLSHYSPKTDCLEISPRQLVALALAHHHPLAQWSIANDGHIRTTWPSHLYWFLYNRGLIAHCFHMHPLLIIPPQSALSALGSVSTLDGAGFLSLCNFRSDEIHVVRDSDELFLVDFAPSDSQHMLLGQSESPVLATLVRWLISPEYTNSLHRSFGQLPIRVHADDVNEQWQEVEQQTSQFIQTALQVADQLKEQWSKA